MAPQIDEITNEQLDESGYAIDVYSAELDRVTKVLDRHVLIGTDVHYFEERHAILRRLLAERIGDDRVYLDAKGGTA